MAESLSIDTYECNGCGSCVEICPEIFQMDESGEKAAVKDPTVAISPAIEEAAAYCPAKCIALHR
jgi:ferredoxin